MPFRFNQFESREKQCIPSKARIYTLSLVSLLVLGSATGGTVSIYLRFMLDFVLVLVPMLVIVTVLTLKFFLAFVLVIQSLKVIGHILALASLRLKHSLSGPSFI